MAVDDTPASLKYMTDLLRAEGHEVRSAINGELALRAAQADPPELVLLDVRMPGLDGFEVCRRLKAHPATREVPVIFVSALSDIDDKVEGFALGAVDFVTKPFQREELLARVGTHLALTRLCTRLESMVDERTRELRGSKEQYDRLVKNIPVGVYQLHVQPGSEPVFTYISPKVRDLLGRSWEAGMTADALTRDVIHPDERERYQRLQEECLAAQTDFLWEGRALREGDVLWLHIESRSEPLPDGSHMRHGIIEDITQRKQAEERLLHLSTHDLLTGLPNRVLFHERLGQDIAAARRFGHPVAVHLLDLNNFKLINDTLGHPVGDQVLREVTRRLSLHIREGDLLARLGGDEFALIQSPPAGPAEAHILAERLLSSLDHPILVGDRPIHTTASVGITLFPPDGDTPEALLRNAEMAMYQAKGGNRGHCAFFQPDMDLRMRQRKQLEEDLRQGLNSDQFYLVYQPKVRAESGAICGMEALLRWRHPERGVISPAEFIPLAEQCGLIVPLGEWVLAAACRQMRLWRQAGLPELRLAVNMSPIQFQRGDPLAAVGKALAESGLPGRALEVEITESALISNLDEARAVLERLNGLGVSIAIDDFGTGYSSLGYLGNLPIDSLKIDQMFVRELQSGTAGRETGGAVVRAIISLAQSLGMRVVAEGVETRRQLDFLQAEGCDEIQGYYFSPPVSAEAFAALVTQGGFRV
ncbi:cyclic di-GMP phosphodiesterase Gmr [mine drainage metagenome]|uniref:Cyclic di-GMP phosphodiesterase Gmr n=1 Tax=mine drainage metagenome TaxID=410659 RepID=A0A1J5R099_9ZZZZ